jgi:N-acetylglucosaminyldiphosphoundecaprenol N-acetyl-beta-D-mannosaminyltransferase
MNTMPSDETPTAGQPIALAAGNRRDAGGTSRRHLFGISIDAVDMPTAIQTIHHWVGQWRQNAAPGTHQKGITPARCKFVVTPNVDHAVMLRDHVGLQAAYRNADMVLADGHPIVWASRLLRQALPGRVAGSDLVPRLLGSARPEQALRVFLLGAAPGIGQIAAANIQRQWPHVQVVGTYSPPLGFDKDAAESDYALGRIALVEPDVVVVGLGAPKQECWVHEHCGRIAAAVALCVGATIDFLAGHKRRAPRWMQLAGVEWLHRMCSEPKRLVQRYARDAWIFPQLVWAQYRQSHRPTR